MATDDQHLLRRWVEYIERDGVNLTPWEEEFMQDMITQAARGRAFSEKQAEIIERIYADRTP